MLKVLHISTYDYEGAATATYRMHENLLNHGVDSKILVSQKTKNDDNLIEIKRSNKNKRMVDFKNKVTGKLKIYKGKYNFIDKQQYVDVEHNVIIQKLGDYFPNIIILHWISNFLRLETVYDLQKYYNAKVFWYQMDMAPMTGGCHYAWECEGYKTNCIYCSAMRWYNNNEPSNYLFYKKRYVDLMSITPLVGGSFVRKQVESSYIFQKQKSEKVIIGINHNIFKPLEDEKLRIEYDLQNTNKRILFFALYDLKNERKGFKYLLEALMLLDKKYPNLKNEILLLTAGHINNDILSKNTSFEIRHIGYLNTQEKLSQAYQLADVFISSSIEDSGPMMVMEAILSGVPVVSFDLGIAQDIVRENETGYAATLKNIDSLVNKIYHISTISNKELLQMKINCRKLGLEELTYQKQYDDFINAIGEIN